MTDPYVIVGLARTRQRWFSDLSRWSTAGSAPIEFLKCLTVEETRAVLGSGRRLSALIVDSGTPGFDRDLIAAAGGCGAPTFVVTDGRVQRDWDSLGCTAVLGSGFAVDQLVELLDRHARPVERSVRRTAHIEIDPEPTRSHTIAVTGAGGVGASTVAACLAQSLARQAAGTVALVDGSRSGDLAMYHDVGDVIPGLPELVEAHRVDHPDPRDIRQLLFGTGDRGYDLLLGLRAPRDWVAMRPHALRAALEGLERAYDLVVIDHDPDLEGEGATGSVGVEDRHGVARAAVHRADLVMAVGLPGIKGVRDLVALIGSLLDEGVPANRIQPVVNRSRRHPASRADVTRTLAELVPAGQDGGRPPLFLRELRGVDAAHRSATLLPDALCRPLGRNARRLLLELGARERDAGVGTPIRAGELGLTPDAPGSADRLHRRSDVA